MSKFGYVCYYCGAEKTQDICSKCFKSTFEKYWKIAGHLYEEVIGFIIRERTYFNEG